MDRAGHQRATGYTAAIGERPTAREAQALRARGRSLKARLAVGRRGLSGEFLDHLRLAFTGADLLKVRLEAEDAAEADALAAEIARLTPCHVIQRVGRVAVLYRPLAEKQA